MKSLASSGRWAFFSDLLRASQMVWDAHAGYTLLVGLLTILQGVLPAAQLWISKLLIDAVAFALQPGAAADPQANLLRLLGLVGAQAGLSFLSILLAAAQDTVRPLLGELLTNRVSLQVLGKINTLEISFFEDEQFYNKLQNAYGEASHRPLEIVYQLFSLARILITLCSVTVLLLRLHWAVLPWILLTTLPVLLVQNRYGHKSYQMLRERAPELRKQYYYGTLLSSDWFVKEVRVFHIENHLLNLYKSLFGKFYQENRKLNLKKNLSQALAASGSTLGWFLAAGYVVLRLVQHSLTIGDFALYTQAVSMAQSGIQALLDGLSGLYANTLFLHNLFEFLALPARDLSAGKCWSGAIEEIEFRDVCFCYPGAERAALDHLSFKVGRGQSLALVGKNGAGKSTVAKLLCRLYEPGAGQILINGKNIAEYSPQSVQEQVAVLFQDYGHYYLSARENIGIGRTAQMQDRAAIRRAAQRSGIDACLEKLPGQYESMLGKWFEDGVQLSGGEWQKIALARAFLRDGSLLVLDEPTASLDAEAEFEIFQDLMHNGHGQIKLFISHRFSTVRLADRILVLEAGQCVEMGSHAELMKAGGQYAHLFTLQAQGYLL